MFVHPYRTWAVEWLFDIIAASAHGTKDDFRPLKGPHIIDTEADGMKWEEMCPLGTLCTQKSLGV